MKIRVDNLKHCVFVDVRRKDLDRTGVVNLIAWLLKAQNRLTGEGGYGIAMDAYQTFKTRENV